MRCLRVILPLPKYEGPNGRSHFRVKHQQSVIDKTLAYAEAGNDVAGFDSVAVIIDWYCTTRRLIDCDNAHARCKYLLDGLTEAGWWPDDSAIRQVTIRRFLPGEGAGFKGRVVIHAMDHAEHALRFPTIDPVFG